MSNVWRNCDLLGKAKKIIHEFNKVMDENDKHITYLMAKTKAKTEIIPEFKKLREPIVAKDVEKNVS